ncbi:MULTISPECIES: hypothetical protein [Pectobacterium]|nr:MULTISPECIES: hypothetical protein [Pectobacterium]WDF99957.1 hypothetical protein PSR30_05195 [Pectobacterium carotovorum subsp. carotovorum]
MANLTDARHLSIEMECQKYTGWQMKNITCECAILPLMAAI